MSSSAEDTDDRPGVDLDPIEVDRLRHFARLNDLAMQLFLVSTDEGRIVEVNASAERVYGISRDEFLSRTIFDFAPPEAVEVLIDVAARIESGETWVEFLVPAVSPSGREFIFEAITTRDSESGLWFTIERDVRERVEQAREMEIGKRFFDVSASHLALLQRDGTILRTNPAFEEWFGGTEHTHDSIFDVVDAGSSLDLKEAIDRVLAGETADESTVIRSAHTDRLGSASLTIAPDDELIYFSSRDVTEQRRLHDELRRRATHDHLTGLANRSLFDEVLSSILADGTDVTVVAIDFDDFKKVNDSLGHAVGDSLLRAAAKRMSECVRSTDLVARLGGDEFAVLLIGEVAGETATRLAETLRAELARPFVFDDHTIQISGSFGLASAASASLSRAGLMRRADMACYEAKRAGRNTVRRHLSKTERSSGSRI